MAEAILSRDEKRKIREQKELERLIKARNKPKFAGYLFFFLFVVTLVYFTDEISTNIGKFLELDVTNFFFGSQEAANSSSVRALVTTLVSVIAGVAMFLRPLADRFGRRPFLVIYTLGMAIGMSLIAIINHISGWVIGTLMIQMCIPHDMQQVYIQECAPKEKRGTYFFVIKGLATLSLLIVPLLRLIFGEVENNFKLIYGIVGVFGAVSAILAFIFMRESDVYLDYRIKELKLTDEERAKRKAKKDDDAKKGGMVAGFIYVIKHKQLLFLMFAMMLVMFSYVLTDNYNTIMAVGYLQQSGIEVVSENYTLASSFTNNAILTYPLGCGLIVLLPGFISDRIGRKKGAVLFGGLALVLYALFFIGSRNVWSPYIQGLLIGAACGSIWSCGDLVLLITTESSGTNLRVSANAVVLMCAGLVYTIGQTIIGAIGAAIGDTALPIITMIAVAIGLSIGLIILILKVKETKGMDLEKVNPDEIKG